MLTHAHRTRTSSLRWERRGDLVISPSLALECRGCGDRFPVEPLTICEECFGPLEPAHDLAAIDGTDFGLKRFEAISGASTGRLADATAAHAAKAGMLFVRDER